VFTLVSEIVPPWTIFPFETVPLVKVRLPPATRALGACGEEVALLPML
jgi:hypothetical protein